MKEALDDQLGMNACQSIFSLPANHTFLTIIPEQQEDLMLGTSHQRDRLMRDSGIHIRREAKRRLQQLGNPRHRRDRQFTTRHPSYQQQLMERVGNSVTRLQ